MKELPLSPYNEAHPWFTDDGIAFLCLIFSHDSVSSVGLSFFSKPLFFLFLFIDWRFGLLEFISIMSLAAVKKRKDHWVETAAGRYLHSARLFLVSNFHILLLETCGDRLFIFFSFFCLTGCPSLRKI